MIAARQPVGFSANFPNRTRCARVARTGAPDASRSLGNVPRVRFIVLVFMLLGVLPARDAQGAEALEHGTAITDPLALRELDRGPFGLGRVMLPKASSDGPLNNSQLFALPSMVVARKA